MASKKPGKAKIELMALVTLVAAGAAGLTAAYKSVASLVDSGDAEINPGYGDGGVDADGLCQVRATEQGFSKVPEPEAPALLCAEANCSVEVVSQLDVAVVNSDLIAQAKPKPIGYQISGNVPIPKVIRGGRNGSKYPFDRLEVGQSFFVPDSEGGKRGAARTMGSAVSVANKHAGEKRFVVRAVTEDGISGARVWRVEVNSQG